MIKLTNMIQGLKNNKFQKFLNKKSLVFLVIAILVVVIVLTSVVASNNTLTVNSSGAANVVITGAVEAHGGITNYAHSLTRGTAITLTAPTTTGGLTFVNWTGCDSVSGTNGVACSLILDTSRTVTANYAVFDIFIVNSSGAANVVITGAVEAHGGITNYAHSLTRGTAITLTAPTTTGGLTFVNWTGCDSVSGTNGVACSLILDTSRTVTANYAPTLTVNSSGATAVVITGAVEAHGGITNYAHSLTRGTAIALTAPTTTGGLTFVNWTGCDNVSGAHGVTCDLTLNTSRTVTANYAVLYTLTVNSVDYMMPFNTVITGAIKAHGGTTSYTRFLTPGTAIALTAPDKLGDWAFDYWVGCDSVSGTGNRTCNLILNTNRVVTAEMYWW